MDLAFIFNHVPPEKLENLIPFVSDNICTKIIASESQEGYACIQMKIISGGMQDKVEALLGIRFTDLDTGITFSVGFHTDDDVKFINNGTIARALGMESVGLVVQAHINRSTTIDNKPVSFNSGIMMTNLKGKFKITAFNFLTGLEHDLLTPVQLNPIADAAKITK